MKKNKNAGKYTMVDVLEISKSLLLDLYNAGYPTSMVGAILSMAKHENTVISTVKFYSSCADRLDKAQEMLEDGVDVKDVAKKLGLGVHETERRR